jgi:hypothetical protein
MLVIFIVASSAWAVSRMPYRSDDQWILRLDFIPDHGDVLACPGPTERDRPAALAADSGLLVIAGKNLDILLDAYSIGCNVLHIAVGIVFQIPEDLPPVIYRFPPASV